MFKIGDMVMVKKDLVAKKHYGHNIFTEGMLKYRGNIGKITECFDDLNEFRLDIDDGKFYWTGEMLKPINKELTIYSTDTEFIIERNGKYITDKPYEFDSAINTVIRYAEEGSYPDYGSIYYIVTYDFDTYRYIIKEHTWMGLENEKEQYDNSGIFTNKEKANRVANEFNKIMEEYNNG